MQVTIPIFISKQDYLLWYKGLARQVITTDIEGRSVQFPVNILQRFITHEGIAGVFTISFDEKGCFKDIQRIEDV